MPAWCPNPAFWAAVCLLSLSSAQAAPAEPWREGTPLMLCQAHPRGGDQFYHPLQHCCLNGALVPLARTRGCGSCRFRVCFELCCPRWPLGLKEPFTGEDTVVKLRTEDCSSPVGFVTENRQAWSPADRSCSPGSASSHSPAL